MAKLIFIAESDYPAIVDWEGEGAQPCDVIYQIISDPTLDLKAAAADQASNLMQVHEDEDGSREE